mgnify:FL=1
MLQSDESICRLHGKTVLIQSRKAFCATTDSVLLADFCRVRAGDRCLDLGSGQGILAVSLLSRYEPKSVTALECDTILCERLQRTAEQNGTDNLRVVQGDLRNIEALFRPGSFDFAAANPPYFPVGAGKPPKDPARRAALCEESATLEDVLRAGLYALRFSGRMCLCLPVQRICEAAVLARQFGGELKRMRLVAAYAQSAPRLALLEIRRGGKPGLQVEPLLVLYDAPGVWSAQAKKAYREEEE